MCKKGGISVDWILGVLIGIVGFVDVEKNFVYWLFLFKGWNYDLGGYLFKYLLFFVFIENDVNFVVKVE